jgi:pimeloyl-ACP methyl ester carboxylesterase
MNTPHERLTRTTFSLPLGEVHALVGGAVNARPLLFLHGFPDHPPTAVPFLEHLAETHRVVAPWLRGYAPSPIVGPYDLDTLAADALALIDHLGGQVDLVGHDWGGMIFASHQCDRASLCAGDHTRESQDLLDPCRCLERRPSRIAGGTLEATYWIDCLSQRPAVPPRTAA